MIVALILALSTRLILWLWVLCQRLLPSNIVLRRFRARDRLVWAPLAGLVGVAVYYGLFQLVSHGYYHWEWGQWSLYAGIPVVLSLAKFAWFIPLSIVRLGWFKINEIIAVERSIRMLRREYRSAGEPMPALTRDDRRVLHRAVREEGYVA